MFMLASALFAIGLGMPELMVILLVLLLLFGGSRLPQLAKGLGSSLKEFKKGVAEGEPDNELKPSERERLLAEELEAARRERLRGQG